MDSIRKSLSHLSCPECNGKLQGTPGGIEQGCLGAIGMEILFWCSLGGFAILLHSTIDNTYVFTLAITLTIVIAFVIGRNFTVYKCKSCGLETEFRKTKGNGFILLPRNQIK